MSYWLFCKIFYWVSIVFLQRLQNSQKGQYICKCLRLSHVNSIDTKSVAVWRSFVWLHSYLIEYVYGYNLSLEQTPYKSFSSKISPDFFLMPHQGGLTGYLPVSPDHVQDKAHHDIGPMLRICTCVCYQSTERSVHFLIWLGTSILELHGGPVDPTDQNKPSELMLSLHHLDELIVGTYSMLCICKCCAINHEVISNDGGSVVVLLAATILQIRYGDIMSI